MAERAYTATITVRLSDSMDESPLSVLAGILLAELHNSSIPVISCTVTEDFDV